MRYIFIESFYYSIIFQYITSIFYIHSAHFLHKYSILFVHFPQTIFSHFLQLLLILFLLKNAIWQVLRSCEVLGVGLLHSMFLYTFFSFSASSATEIENPFWIILIQYVHSLYKIHAFIAAKS